MVAATALVGGFLRWSTTLLTVDQAAGIAMRLSLLGALIISSLALYLVLLWAARIITVNDLARALRREA